jgi:hypothetical protein
VLRSDSFLVPSRVLDSQVWSSRVVVFSLGGAGSATLKRLPEHKN